MTEIEHQLLQSLLELEKAAATMAATHPKPDLLPLFARLEELTQKLPPATEPMLLHFLHRKSYQKARHLLQELAAR